MLKVIFYGREREPMYCEAIYIFGGNATTDKNIIFPLSLIRKIEVDKIDES